MRVHLKLSVAAIAVAAVVSLPVQRADATALVLDASGTLDAATGFDGMPFGTPLSYTMIAPFNTTSGIPFPAGGLFPTQATFHIAGEPTVTTAVGAADVLIGDSPILGAYFPGIVGPSVSFGVLGTYFTATPPISGFAPGPTVFSDLDAIDQFPGDFALTNGHTLTELIADSITSTVITAAPEPASVALLGVGLLGLGLARRKRR